MKPNDFTYHNFYYEGDDTLQFLYGYDKQRRKTSFSENGALVLEKYFVGLYEKEIFPYNTTLSIWDWDFHEHNLSRSLDLINMFSEAYEFSSLSEENSLAELIPITIEMSSSGNGRVYDPILGRMLSPDRFVQSPGFSQSYNRYSYCWNNPLRYTDPSGDIILGPIIAFGVGMAIYQAGADRMTQTDEEFNLLASAAKGAAIGMAIGSGVSWAASAMGAAGVIASTSALKAKKLTAHLIGGMNNALYNYESNQSFLVSSGYFLSGLLGTAIGTGMAGAESGRPVLGMLANASLNPLIAWADKGDDMDAWIIAQKIVGGALNTFQSTAMYNNELTYMGFENNPIGKGLNYATQAMASEFAYTKEEYYRQINERHLGTFMFGFMSGIVNYEISNIEFDGIQNNNLRLGTTSIVRGIATSSFNYLWDYGLQHNTSMDNGGALTDYDGRWQKQRISFNKFVGVTLQTLFDPND